MAWTSAHISFEIIFKTGESIIAFHVRFMLRWNNTAMDWKFHPEQHHSGITSNVPL